ncbi:Transcriptional regulatory protein sin3, partial [Cladochytrium tenue]
LSDFFVANPPPDRLNPVAVELGLQSTEPFADSMVPNVKDRYTELTRAIFEFIDGKLEAPEFEEKCRSLFGKFGYLMFTIDKVLLAIIKQLQTIISDNRNFSFVDLYFKDRDRKVSSPHKENVYRVMAENYLSEDEMLYRFEYIVQSKVLTIAQLTKDDPISDDSASTEER